MTSRQSEIRYHAIDFTEFLRTRECTVLAAGEVNAQVKKREFNTQRLEAIFKLDRKRKPARFDVQTFGEDLAGFMGMCEKFYKAATWLQKK